MYRRAIIKLVLLSLGLGSGFNLTITYKGEQFNNIQEDRDYVNRKCDQERICVPITFSLIYCNLLNAADRIIEVQNILRDYTCGLFKLQPMVCSPVDNVSETAMCDIDEGRSGEVEDPLSAFYEAMNIQPQEECGKRTLEGDTAQNIAGGSEAPPGKWPWMALLGYTRAGKQGTFFKCGGTLISPKTVLTGAHCLKSSLVEVRLGETDINRKYDCLYPDIGCDGSEKECLKKKYCAKEHVVRKVSKQTVHPRYNSTNWDHDVGLVTLDKAVTISDFIRPICLPSAPGKLSSDRFWFVSGWGATSITDRSLASHLMDIQVSLVTKKECGDAWSVPVLTSQVCAAGADGKAVCEGDSGGPLQALSKGGVWEQGAVVSSGSSICGDPKPSFFTIINQEILDWIKNNMRDKLSKRPS